MLLFKHCIHLYFCGMSNKLINTPSFVNLSFPPHGFLASKIAIHKMLNPYSTTELAAIFAKKNLLSTRLV